MPRDDDLDYTVIGLLVLERMPEGPTTSAVAAEWLARLPFGRVYTAERAAYHNLVAGISPAAAAAHRNPYREWIGALIRVDPYAYVSPGDPGRAARFAARDAMLSHVGNGVAAAMWAAATISLSLAGVAAEHSVRAAVACVPHGFRLREALEEVLAVFDAAQPWERFMALHARLSSAYGWVHAIPNAAAISASLLWGGGDFTRTISLAVLAGGDTDSNGATAGSACGALLGAGRLPEAWVTPLDDTLRTSVAGVANVSISSLAMRCHRLVQASRELAHA